MKATSHASTGHPNERSEHSKRHAGISVIGAALLLSVAFVNQAAAQTPYYNVQWLGSFSGSDMNDKGQVAGFILVNGGTEHAALYSDGKITDLGALAGGSRSQANGINNNGVVVGWSETMDGVGRAFRWSNGVMTSLGTLPGGVESQAWDINDAGQIIGLGDTTQPNTTWPDPEHAFIYSGGVMRSLGNISTIFANFSRAYAINASGDVVGWAANDNFDNHAFLYRGGVMTDLGSLGGDNGLGGTESFANDISDNGTVVGWSYALNGETRGFKSNGGVLTDIGKLPGTSGSTANSINKHGQILGSSDGRVFLLSPAGTLTPIDTRVMGTGWSFEKAVSINNSGQILVKGSKSWTSSGYYLLTPAPAGAEIGVAQPAKTSLVDGKSKKSFGTVKVGRSGTAKTFTITNFGSSKLTGLAITKTGQQKDDFVVSAPAKTSIPPGSSTTFKVTFKPKQKGTRDSAIHIKNNDRNENPFDIKLTGEGAK